MNICKNANRNITMVIMVILVIMVIMIVKGEEVFMIILSS